MGCSAASATQRASFDASASGIDSESSMRFISTRLSRSSGEGGSAKYGSDTLLRRLLLAVRSRGFGPLIRLCIFRSESASSEESLALRGATKKVDSTAHSLRPFLLAIPLHCSLCSTAGRHPLRFFQRTQLPVPDQCPGPCVVEFDICHHHHEIS
eukprot:scaffold10_cov257-Pinguiococcus_pyrenoidosus.AAC.21